jgi:hypothetical protein
LPAIGRHDNRVLHANRAHGFERLVAADHDAVPVHDDRPARAVALETVFERGRATDFALVRVRRVLPEILDRPLARERRQCRSFGLHRFRRSSLCDLRHVGSYPTLKIVQSRPISAISPTVNAIQSNALITRTNNLTGRPTR